MKEKCRVFCCLTQFIFRAGFSSTPVLRAATRDKVQKLSHAYITPTDAQRITVYFSFLFSLVVDVKVQLLPTFVSVFFCFT